jgi:hypothetical protein
MAEVETNANHTIQHILARRIIVPKIFAEYGRVEMNLETHPITHLLEDCRCPILLLNMAV